MDSGCRKDSVTVLIAREWASKAPRQSSVKSGSRSGSLPTDVNLCKLGAYRLKLKRWISSAQRVAVGRCSTELVQENGREEENETKGEREWAAHVSTVVGPCGPVHKCTSFASKLSHFPSLTKIPNMPTFEFLFYLHIIVCIKFK